MADVTMATTSRFLWMVAISIIRPAAMFSDESAKTCDWDVEACWSKDVGKHIWTRARCQAYDIPGFNYPLSGSLDQRREIHHTNAETLATKTFYSDFVLPNAPVVISNAAANLFDDVSSAWTFDGLMSNPKANILYPVKKKYVRLVGPTDDLLNVSGIYLQTERTIFFNAVRTEALTANPRTGKGRRNDFDLSLHKEYFAKLKQPNFLHEFKQDDLPGTFNLHLSNRGGAIPHSHPTTLNILFEGAKRWLLVNPLDYPNKTAREKFEQIDKMDEQRSTQLAYSSQLWYAQEAERDLAQWGVPYYEFIQNEGDAVYIPDYWTHATMDLCRTSVGVELMGAIVHAGQRPESTSHFTERGFFD